VAAPTAGAQSLRRAITVLRALAASQETGVRLTDLATSTGLSRPTLHRILRVLVEEGAVEQDAQTRRYMIGPEMPLLGLARKSRFPIRQLALPYLQNLSRQVGDTIFLSLRTGFDSICVERVVGTYPLQVLALEVGARRPLGIGVSGVAMLAALPKELAESIISTNERRLELNRMDPATLAERVVLARSRGYAYAPSGIVKGTKAVAVPVADPANQVAAAISVACMADRLTPARLPWIVETIRERAAELSHRLEERSRWKGRSR